MGDYLGPYEIRGELGRGAMAIVWRGFDPKLEREVAVKEAVIPATAGPEMTAELAHRFVREGKAAAGLNHPGIVTIHSADVYDGRAAIVMELIEGETLSAIIDRGPMAPAVAAHILDQLLDAVGYAHARGIVHRDIKPDNVFLTHDGRVKLGDFGIAHVGEGTLHTNAGTVMGTPGYMSPEQVTGQPVDLRADLFAIGVIGYELLTGRNPFGATDGDAPTTVMYRIVHEPVLSPAVSVAGLDPHLGDVIATAMAKDPAARFASAEAMRAALAGGPIVASATMPQAPYVAPAPHATPGGYAAPQPQSAGNSAMPYVLVAIAGVVLVGGLMIAANSNRGVGSLPQQSAQEQAQAEPAAAQPVAAKPKPSSRELVPGQVSRVQASSSGKGYSAWGLADNNPVTCWAEGIDRGYGEGQRVTIFFNEKVTITKVGMIPGYDKTDGGGEYWDRFYGNGRVREAQFIFDNGSFEHEFADNRTMQDFTLSTPQSTTKVTIVILSTRPFSYQNGHGGSDTSISEVEFWGFPTAEAN